MKTTFPSTGGHMAFHLVLGQRIPYLIDFGGPSLLTPNSLNTEPRGAGLQVHKDMGVSEN